MRTVRIVAMRELRSQFVTPMAWVSSISFLLLAGMCTFYLGGFLSRGQADLDAFFRFHPWLYLWLAAALTMPMWADERRSGMIELLLTFPVAQSAVVWGKFVAVWILVAFNLLLTLPIWLTVNYLGDPPNQTIAVAYLGSLLMAGTYLAIGSFASTLTRNQIVAFILTLIICTLFVLINVEQIQSMVLRPVLSADTLAVVSSFGFMFRFGALRRGVVDLSDVFYFVAHIVFWLSLASLVIKTRRAQ